METSTAAFNPLVVYLNSNSGVSAGDDQNQVNFNFKTPLHQNEDQLSYVCLTQFICGNSFPNFSYQMNNNTLKILNVMKNNATGIYDYTTYLHVIQIPTAHYSMPQLLAYLNENCNYEVDVTSQSPGWVSSNGGTKAILYMGLGFADGTANDTTTDGIDGFFTYNGTTNITTDTLVVGINCAGAGSSGNAYNKTYTSGTVASDPYFYAGVYLLYDDDTAGFMNNLGFTSLTTLPNGLKGVGFSFPTNVNPANDYATSTSLTNTQVFNIAHPALLYIVIDALTTNARHSDESFEQKHIVGQIPINSFYGGIVNFVQPFPIFTPLQDMGDLTQMRVSIFDENYNLIDFRGVAWAAQLFIKFVAKAGSDKTNQLTANMINDFPKSSSILPDGLYNQTKRPNPYGGVDLNPKLYKSSRQEFLES